FSVDALLPSRQRYFQAANSDCSTSVIRRFPALQGRALPLGSDRRRAFDPRPELRLWKLRVLVLQLDPVRVPRLQVPDQHLPRELVLPTRGDREVDLQERIRVAVEDRRDTVLLEELDVLEPVEIRARRRREQIDLLDEGDVLLVRKAMAGEVLRIQGDRLLGLVNAQSGSVSSTGDGRKSTGY